jgi:hypothetical protein
MVERHVALARRLGQQIQTSPDFELLEQPRLNVVCFRYRAPGLKENELDALNRRIGQAIIADGRVYFGTTVYAGKVPSVPRSRTGARRSPTLTSFCPWLASWLSRCEIPVVSLNGFLGPS